MAVNTHRGTFTSVFTLVGSSFINKHTFVPRAWCQDYSLNPCSIKCKDSVCDLYRNCLECADQNFTGGTCNRCIEGKYGSQCDLNCPLTCLSCDSATKCSLCKKGFNDITCSVKLECLDNCYNDTCLYPSICDSCKDGYFGDHCNVSCSENCRYGTCTEGGSCIGGCKDGFSGAKCELKICPVNCNCDQNNRCFGCKENYFGPSCSLTCSSCKDYQCPEHPLMTEKCNACEEGTYDATKTMGHVHVEKSTSLKVANVCLVLVPLIAQHVLHYIAVTLVLINIIMEKLVNMNVLIVRPEQTVKRLTATVGVYVPMVSLEITVMSYAMRDAKSVNVIIIVYVHLVPLEDMA
ncbi:TENX-like protein [Mya arenaria]|uniref:TENX-like protein n=1 Tax=Mya arenaria TaxID=6604 RepID=A0ABY7F643_MYAAR|nr:TENX-like protein [Mya arenaria]